MNTSRVPTGVPTGGQFAEQAKGESDVSLGAGGGLAGLAAYSEEREKIERNYELLTKNCEQLPADDRQERYGQIADHFEHEAHKAAQAYEPHEVPRPHGATLNGKFGRLATAVDCAAKARLQSLGLAPRDAAGDAILEKALDTRDFTTSNGVPMRARIVRRGEAYGRTGSRVADRDLVMFFDARYPDHPPMIGHETEDREKNESNGQHISTYHLDTLRESGPAGGLRLYGTEPDWDIDPSTYAEIHTWMGRRARQQS